MRACQLAGQPLRDEGTRALPGATELDDVEPVVVRLDQTGQRAALAQGRHVARGDDGPHHAAERSGLIRSCDSYYEIVECLAMRAGRVC